MHSWVGWFIGLWKVVAFWLFVAVQGFFSSVRSKCAMIDIAFDESSVALVALQKLQLQWCISMFFVIETGMMLTRIWCHRHAIFWCLQFWIDFILSKHEWKQKQKFCQTPIVGCAKVMTIEFSKLNIDIYPFPIEIVLCLMHFVLR